MSGEEILVTGGAGYIGSHTCLKLAERGFKPVVVDNFVTGHDWAVQWGPVHRGDLRDQEFLKKVFSQHQFAAVLHFAAFAYVGESMRDPVKYYDNNVFGSISLVRAMQAHRVSRLVFSSTCATYGEPEKMPIEEHFPQNPVNPYGRTKWIVEQFLKDLAATSGLQAIALRYFNAAGADIEGRTGEHHDPETHLIPLVIEAAHRGTPITIFGEDYPTPDRTCIRDYVHVSDLALAHVQAIDWLGKQKSGCFEAFNLGTGHGYSVKQIIDSVERVTGKKVQRKIGERRPGDPPTLVATGLKAKRELGWIPQFSKIDEIVKTADRWYQKHF